MRLYYDFPTIPTRYLRENSCRRFLQGSVLSEDPINNQSICEQIWMQPWAFVSFFLWSRGVRVGGVGIQVEVDGEWGVGKFAN